MHQQCIKCQEKYNFKPLYAFKWEEKVSWFCIECAKNLNLVKKEDYKRDESSKPLKIINYSYHY